ncbi:MAG: YcxB family protein [bacterium]|nr:YcxB family protein [bacterium]
METELNTQDKRLAGGKTVTNPKLLKDLYKTYYSELWKTARIILTIVGTALLILAVMAYTAELPVMYMFIPTWIGAVMIIYPRNAYRKPYKAAKNEQSTVFFSFYDSEMREKTDGSVLKFRYDTMYEIIETPLYFFFFHTKRDVSILEKEGINRGTAEGLSAMLKMRVNKYKTVK